MHGAVTPDAAGFCLTVSAHKYLSSKVPKTATED